MTPIATARVDNNIAKVKNRHVLIIIKGIASIQHDL